MYKVLFAEDELLVRLGLQNSIPWSKYQMELSALAENGIEAFRLFESIRPDVLITDLRMEGMDGVELVKRVRQIDKDCAIVVVSCMNDFETLLISILGSFIVILSILFYITYHYFVAKIETGNEKVVLMTFEQAEKNLKNVLKNAELCLDKYVTNDLIWDFENNYPETDIESNELKVKITDSFINEMSVNREVSALGFLRGDGWGIVSSVLRKNRTGNTQISGNLLKVLKQSKDAYPYTTWIPSWELNLNNESPLRLMSQNASLIEVKVINSGVFFDEIQLKEIYMKMKTFSKASDHIGMANVYKRLNLLYGDQGSMRVESNRKLGFIVEVSFPKSTKM